jgi:hypothetical protein
MKFLCVCHYDAAAFAKLGPADFAKLGELCAPHDKALKATGKVSLIGSLGMPHQSRTLRADGDSVRVVEGPYAATAEPFGAFFIVEADDIDKAVGIARMHPGAHLGAMFGGGIEVRPIESLEQL